MKQIYNWDKNMIQIEDKLGNSFNLQLRGHITVICGRSASGKTLLWNKIADTQKNTNGSIRKYTAENICLIDISNVSSIYGQKHKLIMIDRADSVVNEKIAERINTDPHNRYLIFARKPIGMRISPNHYGEFVITNKEVTIYYEFNVKGWC